MSFTTPLPKLASPFNLRAARETKDMPKISKVVKREGATQIIRGIAKRYAKQAEMWIGGKRYTPKELIGLFQSLIDAIDRVNATRAAAADAIAAETKVAARVRDATRYLKLAVRAEFEDSPVAWNDFGWQVPKKPGPKTAQAKLEGARKVQETRKARGTMGKRQKKKIRGW